MDTVIPLDRMTTAEKLRALEEIWADLQRNSEAIASPAWHEDVLRARQQRLEDGSTQAADWDEAKRRIRDRAR